jgi:hypothetical protein
MVRSGDQRHAGEMRLDQTRGFGGDGQPLRLALPPALGGVGEQPCMFCRTERLARHLRRPILANAGAEVLQEAGGRGVEMADIGAAALAFPVTIDRHAAQLAIPSCGPSISLRINRHG